MIRVWNTDYASQGKMGASIWYSATSSNTSVIRGDRNEGGGMGPSGTPPSPYIEWLPAENINAWNQIRWHFKHRDVDGDDALIELWINGVKVMSWTDLNQALDPTYPNFNQGYLLGAANSGYAEETSFYLDDIKFWDEDPLWEGTVDTFTNISRDAASVTGGDKVFLTVSNIVGTPTVKFGNNYAREVAVVNANTISCRVPVGHAGTASVVCGGVSLTNPRQHLISGSFEYLRTSSTIFVDRNFDDGTVGTGLTIPAGMAGSIVTASSEVVYSGSYAMKFVGPSGSSGNASIRNSVTMSIADELNGIYGRYYYYAPQSTANAVSGAYQQIKTHLWRRAAGSGQPGWLMSGFGSAFPDGNADATHYVTFIDNGIINIGPSNIYGRSSASMDTWVEFIYWSYWDTGSSQGVAKLWIDGQLQLSVTHPNLGSTGSDYRFNMGIAYQEPPSTDTTVYVDQVYIGNGFPPTVEI